MSTPEFLWAQNKDLIYLTVDVPNLVKEGCKVKLEESGKLVFSGVGGAESEMHEYVLDIQLLKEIDVNGSEYHIGARNLQFKLKKKVGGEFWDKLLEGGKNVHCKIDWDHWRDEDEEDTNMDFGSSWNPQDVSSLDFNAAGGDEMMDDSMPDLEEPSEE
mmetsp:Transcript_5359/g.9402  ORF Transcript_5359/g.9402 Transcript_5359/m.9402 type:complete len:159 (+) Transcript_5359:87-563(+)